MVNVAPQQNGGTTNHTRTIYLNKQLAIWQAKGLIVLSLWDVETESPVGEDDILDVSPVY